MSIPLLLVMAGASLALLTTGGTVYGRATRARAVVAGRWGRLAQVYALWATGLGLLALGAMALLLAHGGWLLGGLVMALGTMSLGLLFGATAALEEAHAAGTPSVLGAEDRLATLAPWPSGRWGA